MKMTEPIAVRIRQGIIYGLVMALILFFLKWLEWKFLIVDHSIDIYIGAIALSFTVLGIWIANQLFHRRVKTLIVEKEVVVRDNGPFVVDQAALARLELTNRELEVLQLMAKGMSNADIGEALFISLSTVKTHASKVLAKLEVKSRVQALDKARKLRLIP